MELLNYSSPGCFRPFTLPGLALLARRNTPFFGLMRDEDLSKEFRKELN